MKTFKFGANEQNTHPNDSVQNKRIFTDDLNLFRHLLDFANMDYSQSADMQKQRIFQQVNGYQLALFNPPAKSYLTQHARGYSGEQQSATPISSSMGLLRLLKQQVEFFQNHLATSRECADPRLAKLIYKTLAALSSFEDKAQFISGMHHLHAHLPDLLKPDVYREVITKTRSARARATDPGMVTPPLMQY